MVQSRAIRADMDTLREAGIETTDQVISAMAFYIRSRQEGPVQQGGSPLSEYESRLLLEVGGIGGAPIDKSVEEANRRTLALEFANLIAHAKSPLDAAKALRVSPSRIRQRIAEGSLYAVAGPGGRVLPDFQFDASNRTLPHLAQVLNVIPEGTHPLAVCRFFETPAADLPMDDSGTLLSPTDWLYTGHPVEPVILLAKNL